MQYLIQGGILDDRQFKYIKYCFSKDAPFSIEQKTSTERLTIAHCWRKYSDARHSENMPNSKDLLNLIIV